ncbi:MAG TPA: 3-phosphoshikimate 1-carboxyvinyltransferase, partial [Clostridiales bacterium]|nr:3-phosphoshikimate 1-carboxyvinyltransferase [Clostridiales bacterium]
GGTGRLKGGRANAMGDHRIAMSIAVAAVICDAPVIIENAEAVNKSYPDFYTDYIKLGAIIEQKGLI